jgi:hypothetical protein
MQKILFENMEFDVSTGQAWVNGQETGWSFEFAMQGLPAPGENMDTSRKVTLISPWAFATRKTADKIRTMMEQHTGRKFEIEQGDENTQFPTNVRQLYIVAKENGKNASVNAGLVASQIARTTAIVSDGVGGYRRVQNSAMAIAEALTTIERELGS